MKLNDKYDKDFIFYEDGATCHTGGYANWWKTSHSIRRFDYWLAQSPDLNPIEHIWSCLDKLIDNKRSSISNADELKTALEEVWESITVEVAGRLVDSMKDGCQAVIKPKVAQQNIRNSLFYFNKVYMLCYSPVYFGVIHMCSEHVTFHTKYMMIFGTSKNKKVYLNYP